MKIRGILLGFGLLVSYAQVLFAVPVVTGIQPNRGPTAGGTTITISGTGFSGATSVKFGPTSVTIPPNPSDATIVVTTPQDVIGTVDVQVGSSVITPDDQFTFQGNWKAYVGAESGNSFAIDLTTKEVTTLDFSPFTSPSSTGIAITPDGRFVYFANRSSNNVLIIDSKTNSARAASPSIGESSNYVAISPNNPFAYVMAGNTLHSINTDDLSVDTSPGFPPGGIINVGTADFSVTPNGQFVYAPNAINSNEVTIVNLSDATLSFTAPLLQELTPNATAFTPNGNKLFIAGTNNTAFNLQVHVITTSNNQEQGSPTQISGVSPSPEINFMAITPDGRFCYVEDVIGSPVTKIDTSTNSIVSSIPLASFGGPAGIAITPDGKTAYVANTFTNSIQPIDVNTDTPGAPMPLPGINSLTPIAITPDPAPAANFTFVTGKVKTATTFDASLSATAVGTIVSYVWDFGDSTPLVTTSSPTVSHIYQNAGTFDVTLTVTNSAGTSTAQTFTGHTVSNAGSTRAARTKAVIIITPPPSVVVPPTRFIGNVIEHHDSKFVLKSHFKKSISPNIAFYEVFAHNKRIAKISARDTKFKRHLHTMDFYQEHTKKYKRYLDRKYKIRAVNTLGIRSKFVFLHVKKVRTDED